jgi:general secretion pathway protein A
VDDQPKPLADDPSFLESLGELDRGLEPVDPARVPRAPVRPLTPRTGAAPPAAPPRAPEPPAPQRAAPPLVRLPPVQYPPPSSDSPDARQGGTRRRALLDLFPPAPGEAAPPSPQPPPAARPPVPPILKPVQPPVAQQAGRRPSLADMIGLPPEEITYETFYGLTEKPFSQSSDPKFFYHSNAHDRVAQELLSAIRRRDASVIITGEPGTGKTMLCRAVMEELDHRTLTSFVPEPFVSIEELVKTVLVDFGVISHADLVSGRLAHATWNHLTAALNEFLQSLAALEAFAVVIIDEAQKLPIDALEQVRRLADTGAELRLLQVVLVGQPKLLRVLNRDDVRPLAERASVRETLQPLADDEVVGYVLHRLAVAGANTRVVFDDGAFERIYEISAGVPRVINLLCDRALTLGYQASASVIDAAIIDRAADDLDIEVPETGVMRAIRIALNVVMLVALMLVGAAAAAVVFRDRVRQSIVQWEAMPTPPHAPQLRQPSPLKALPAPEPAENLPTRPRN